MVAAQPNLVLVLNGICSVGKSSIAKALQTLVARPLLHVEGDMFLRMLPPKLWGEAEGISVETSEKQGFQTLSIEIGPAAKHLMEGMRAAVGALAKQGNDLIVDDLMLSEADQQSYLKYVVDCDLRFVGLHAPLDLLEARERERGDRMGGLARWQSSRVHKGIDYDFELDTSEMTIDGCARRIAAEFALL